MREAARLFKLVGVSTFPYRSRDGGAIKLEFEGHRFSYVHRATPEMLAEWQEQIEAYFWVRRVWKFDLRSPSVQWPDYIVEKRA